MNASPAPIAAIAIVLLASPPLRAETTVDAHALCDAHADALITALGDAHYNEATADFDAALRSRYTILQLSKDYESLPSRYGKMLGRGRPHTGDAGGHTVVLTPLIFERGTITAEVHCSSDGAVSDLRLDVTQVMGNP